MRVVCAGLTLLSLRSGNSIVEAGGKLQLRGVAPEVAVMQKIVAHVAVLQGVNRHQSGKIRNFPQLRA